jgi:ribosomal protein S18 acetylase RimI-like enzyme
MVFSLDDPAESHLIDPITTFEGLVWCIRPANTLSDNALLASAALSLSNNRTTAEIKTVYVHPTARRQGLGRAMTHHCIAYAKAQHIPEIVLWSDTRFAAAHALYGSMGFTQTGKRACDDFNNSHEFGYRLGRAENE